MLKKWTRPPLGRLIAAELKPEEVRLMGASVGVLVLLLDPPQATNVDATTISASRMYPPCNCAPLPRRDRVGGRPVESTTRRRVAVFCGRAPPDGRVDVVGTPTTL